MKILKHESLTVGDIILTTTDEPISFAIRKATKSDISHAMIYVDTCSVIDATSEGVHARNTQRLFIEDNRAVHVLRLKDRITQQQKVAVCDYVRARVGTQYTKREAIKTITGGSASWSQKQFCSRLVAQAYASAGINLVDNINFCSPNDILRSAILEEVTNVTREATDADLKFEESSGLLQQMHDTTNAFLDRVRARNSAIQDFNDVSQHLIKNPTDDDFFFKALEESGYLTVWQLETDSSPWHYNLALMETIPFTDDIKKYCSIMVEDPGQARRQRAINAHVSEQLYASHPLKTFKALHDLNAHLLHLLHARRAVAAMWLSRHAPDEFSPIVPIPHTAEWFEQLDIEEPQKAQMTRTVLASAENNNVCSICGDTPAFDYRREGLMLPGILTLTLRLCDDCLKGRDQLFGEKFIPLEGPANKSEA